MPYGKVDKAIEDIRNGKFIIVVDSEDRENEGDLVMASELVTPDAVNFMAKEARGLICVSLSSERALDLDLAPMERRNTSLHKTAFTVSVDAVQNTTTGTSAYDRFQTIRTLIASDSVAEDLGRPGHVFPIVGKEGGVLRRSGHTEASMDIARMAGLQPSGTICEIMAEDGTMARFSELQTFSEKHDLVMITIEDLIRYRRSKENLVKRIETVAMPTGMGEFRLHLYEDLYADDSHLALTIGDIQAEESVLVRIHSECLTGDVFGSMRCDCGDQLNEAMKKIADVGTGIIVYLRQEGRGIGLAHKIKAYKLQEDGLDTVEANVKLGFPPDLRDYGVGAQIIYDLGARKLIVMTNNPMKLVGLEGHGLEIVDRKSINIGANECNRGYLETKKTKLGHLIE
ncbi:MAG TPA: bifunctional 3,4-dihydroxy-2-butanone-4-phosphate synthase/GTP cyclohydrolase II [Chloroflexi bacterium]|nr:bifunctional 3,4-dihydroxy-2-butanone-4-phosphate synthase/GTP cyclohydrolase II [Chloroflexota bacterium]